MHGMPWDLDIATGTLIFLLVALAVALGFEAINGFHDAANAVATVIYTNSLKPWQAVAWSGFCNFCGVHLGGTAVAFSIVHLLPVDLLVAIGSTEGMAMVLALLVAAILWNFGTWFLAIPASSSHTLIGAILGVGMAHAALDGKAFGDGVNWHKASEVGLSLLLSPLVGFGLAFLLLKIFRQLTDRAELYQPASPDERPPAWIRGTLIATCTGVSLAHGSNDGQKGIGLIMLILIGVLPAHYALNPEYGEGKTHQLAQAAGAIEAALRDGGDGPADDRVVAALGQLADLRVRLEATPTLRDFSIQERWRVRTDILRAQETLTSLHEEGGEAVLSDEEWDDLEDSRALFGESIYYAPSWVQVAVSLALGLGTMVGWKRIVVTVGEKIGKAHLSYAQGAAAEIVAMGTIGIADLGGLPVSTTHVLSSGIAGTMAASHSGLQFGTIRKILLAWVLTLPASMLLSAGLFLVFRRVLPWVL